MLSVGVPKEIARVVMPVGRYSKMWASANLRNWLGFINLRDSPDAQWEIRQYAAEIRAQLSNAFPRAMEAMNKDNQQ
jgi:thymidylate synthase (FAD)